MRRIPIFAPRLAPPCFMTSVAMLKTLMKDTGPLAAPIVDLTTSLAGLSLEKEKPVPPPVWWIFAVSLTDSKMESRESSTGRTKHADSWPNSRPAFIRAGEFGRNSRSFMIRKKESAIFFLPVLSRDTSAEATWSATRRNIISGVSIGFPWSSLMK